MDASIASLDSGFVSLFKDYCELLSAYQLYNNSK
jgi:hypothetical protein